MVEDAEDTAAAPRSREMVAANRHADAKQRAVRRHRFAVRVVLPVGHQILRVVQILMRVVAAAVDQHRAAAAAVVHHRAVAVVVVQRRVAAQHLGAAHRAAAAVEAALVVEAVHHTELTELPRDTRADPAQIHQSSLLVLRKFLQA